MSENVRSDMLIDARSLDGGSEALADGAHRLAGPLDNGVFCDPEPLPPAQMSEQAIWQAHCRLAFLGLPSTSGAPVKDAALKIDMTSPDGRMKRRAADGGMTCPCVEPY